MNKLELDKKRDELAEKSIHLELVRLCAKDQDYLVKLKLRMKSFKVENECWNWTKARNEKGYGSIGIGSRHFLAHRVSYFLEYREEKGLVLHKCNNSSCINPKHLYLGTHKENVADCVKSGRRPEQKQTACLKGHDYTSKNTGIDHKGTRYCKECKRIKAQEVRDRKKANG